MVESYEFKGRTIEIHFDTDPLNPRKFVDHLFTLLAWHSRYTIGDVNCIRDESVIRSRIPARAVIYPVYMYEHSGVTISLNPFTDMWDSGQVGFLFVTREKALTEYNAKLMTAHLRAKLLANARAEISEYDSYLRGDVYGYITRDENGQEIDSCWGFYGLDHVKQSAEENIR